MDMNMQNHMPISSLDLMATTSQYKGIIKFQSNILTSREHLVFSISHMLLRYVGPNVGIFDSMDKFNH